VGIGRGGIMLINPFDESVNRLEKGTSKMLFQ
jgi:hypothetical protein